MCVYLLVFLKFFISSIILCLLFSAINLFLCLLFCIFFFFAFVLLLQSGRNVSLIIWFAEYNTFKVNGISKWTVEQYVNHSVITAQCMKLAVENIPILILLLFLNLFIDCYFNYYTHICNIHVLISHFNFAVLLRLLTHCWFIFSSILLLFASLCFAFLLCIVSCVLPFIKYTRIFGFAGALVHPHKMIYLNNSSVLHFL